MSEENPPSRNDPLSQFLKLVGASGITIESQDETDVVNQFIKAAFLPMIQDRLNDNLRAFFQSLKDLTIPDAVDTLRVIAGFDPQDRSFFERMRDKGWIFELDLNSVESIKSRNNQSSFPKISNRVSFPNGENSIGLSDVINIFQAPNNT